MNQIEVELTQEAKLIEKAKKDPDSFGILFDRHYDQILNYSFRRVGDLAVAEDITSTVFMKAYKKLWQFHWRGVPFLAWLYRIAGNEVKTYFRKGNQGLVSLEDLKERSGFEPRTAERVEQELIEKEERIFAQQKFRRVVELLKHMDSKYQEVLQLRYFEEKKVREISQIVGKKEGTVKSLLSRGVKKLKDMMIAEGEITSSVVEPIRINDKKRKSRNVFRYQFLQSE